MAVTVYQYPKCSTCRKALKWLDSRGIAYRTVDIVADPPLAATLERLLRRSGLPVAKFFNTSGQSYRAGNFRERLASMTEAEACAALAADGKLIKRPLVDAPNAVLVGFDADAWAEALE
ncbi:MAG: Spx/MgsR family RNA polymerase-binding regulatory protein [Acidobacteriota bacterium]|jgi:arsenate reductase|nr:MAG: hypothetical protein DIU54_04380 [Acidobacteriota bacterium]